MSKEDICSICSICYESIENTIRMITSCNHIFHQPCLYTWIKEKKNCPLCRTNIELPKDTVNEWKIAVYEENFENLIELFPTCHDKKIFKKKEYNEYSNAIFYAICNNNLVLFRHFTLIYHHYRIPYPKDSDKTTVLMWMIICKRDNNYFNSLSFCEQHIYERNQDGHDALYYCVQFDYRHLLLLESYAKKNGFTLKFDGKYEDGWTLLHASIAYSNENAFYYFLNRIEVNVKDDNNDNLLVTCIDMLQLYYMDELLKKGIDKNHQNNKGETAIMIAAKKCNYKAVGLLLKYGADTTLHTDDGKTFMDFLSQSFIQQVDDELNKRNPRSDTEDTYSDSESLSF
jgi:ankyrin repeat protein